MISSSRLQRPGFGLPLEQMPSLSEEQMPSSDHSERFPHAIADYFAIEGITLREQRMLDFINQITDKPKWWEKIHDQEILARWRSEACGSKEQQRTSSAHLDAGCFDYCIKELQDKAAYFARFNVIHVLDIAATVVKTDVDETDACWQALREAVRPLEDIPDRLKDWHPGSNGLVLDLVHPSPFPLQFGKSRVLPQGTVPLENCEQYAGLGETVPVQGVAALNANYDNEGLKPWGDYQWLPSEVKLDSDGTARITSYVNNVHPRDHPDIYEVFELAVGKAVPLWNECLSWFHSRHRLHVESCGFEDYDREAYTEYVRAAKVASGEATRNGEEGEEQGGGEEGEAGDAEAAEKEGAAGEVGEAAGGAEEKSEDGEDEDEDEDENDEELDTEEEDRYRDWLRDHPNERRAVQPTTNGYKDFEARLQHPEKWTDGKADEPELIARRNLQTDFPDGLQVIFKLANIHLTPEKPEYDGSNWHVEGALNEHICATALFYYDSENVEENYLQFRQRVDWEGMTEKPPQDEYQICEDLFGVEYQGVAVQEVGRVMTRAGRWIAFPNVMQHRVSSFRLRDASKPGHRKILAMFLVDPHIKILSTANVPPQRRDWWARAIRQSDPFAALPIELFDRIIDNVNDFPIAMEDAHETREALMAERGRVKESYEEMLKKNTFFFCEH